MLGITTVIFFSCKKESTHSVVNEQMITSVHTWLDKQQNPNKPNRSNNIKTLKTHLNLAAMEEIKYARGSTVVIPIDNEFRTFAKISEGSILNLVVLVNKDGSIRNAHVAIYTAPKDQQVTELAATTFHNIFHTAENVTDGQYRFLSPAGTKEYQLEYKNGRMSSEGRFTTNPKNGGAVQTNGVRVNSISCIDWYLVTTYYSNGVQVNQTSEYLGRTCVGCDNSEYEMLCGADEVSGVGSILEVYEYAKEHFKAWAAEQLNDTATVWAFVTFTTEFNTYFTHMRIGTPSACSNCPSNITYQHTHNSGNISSGLTSASTTVTGGLTYSDNPELSRQINKTKNWAYSDL